MNNNNQMLLLATRNPGKVREIRELLADLHIEIRSGLDLEDVPEVDETEDTLEGNARLKAETIHRITGIPTLSDDTGLEVAVLGGDPGVRSARYAGETATPADNRVLLLNEMLGQDNRSAQFRTVVALTDATGTYMFEGSCPGSIVESGRGQGGFGYDELFVPKGFDKTFAELDPGTKNAVSHRGDALRRCIEFLSIHRLVGANG